MSRGTTLANLRLMLRAEIGQTMDTTAATQNNNSLNQLLANKQSWLARSFDFPFLQQRWDLAAAQGSRYLTLPTTPNSPGNGAAIAINFERPVCVEVLFNSFYHELEYGIDVADYNRVDSDTSQTLDPIQKWRFATNVNETTNANQIEIWPMPATAQTVRFTGQRALKTLFDASQSATTNDAYTADLDDLLIVLLVAADILSTQKNPLASVKGQMGMELLTRLRASYPGTNSRLVLGAQTDQQKKKYVLVAP